MIELVQRWNDKGLSVLKATKVLCFPRSTYYSNLKLGKGNQMEVKECCKKGRPYSRTTLRFIYSDNDVRKVSVDDKALLEEILNLFSNEFVCYGYHKVTWFLRRNGYEINHKKVYRLMKEFHLLRPKLVKHGVNMRRVKEYKVEALRPDEVWEIDVKSLYIHGERRNAFLCSVIDCFTREDLAYHFGRHCLKEDVLRVLEEACKMRNISFSNVLLRVRSDNGSQFISRLVKSYLESIGIEQEHIDVATPQENGFIESFHSIIQSEFNERFEFDTIEECRQKLKEWITFYNNERIHSAIGYRTPRECHEEYMKNSLGVLTH
jgi:putative transposase